LTFGKDEVCTNTDEFLNHSAGKNIRADFVKNINLYAKLKHGLLILLFTNLLPILR